MPPGEDPTARSPSAPPLVLVHGLFDTPRAFDHLRRCLGGRRKPLLIPDLPLRWGITSIERSAGLLARQIETAFGDRQPIDILGFSMGGVIARTWIQLMGGHRRTRRFLSLGSPQQGTLTALPWPGRWLGGIADLKPASPLLRQLDADLSTLEGIACSSYYCALDLMVIPGPRAVLPIGDRRPLQVWTHRQLLRHPAALSPLVEELLRA